MPLSTMLHQITTTLEEEIAPALPSAYLRSQALGIASLLDNLAERMEERCSLLQQENRELREALLAIAERLGHAPWQRALRELIVVRTGEEAPKPTQENLKLKEGLVEVIQALPGLGLAAGVEAEAVRLIRRQLRRQLERELALHRPTRFGRLSTGG